LFCRVARLRIGYSIFNTAKVSKLTKFEREIPLWP
jgi:hypothetical protein